MTITQFDLLIAKAEGLKKQVNIAQIKEVRKCINKLTNGALNKAIREL